MSENFQAISEQIKTLTLQLNKHRREFASFEPWQDKFLEVKAEEKRVQKQLNQLGKEFRVHQQKVTNYIVLNEEYEQTRANLQGMTKDEDQSDEKQKLTDEVTELKAKVTELKAKVTELKAEVTELKVEVTHREEEINYLMVTDQSDDETSFVLAPESPITEDDPETTPEDQRDDAAAEPGNWCQRLLKGTTSRVFNIMVDSLYWYILTCILNYTINAYCSDYNLKYNTPPPF